MKKTALLLALITFFIAVTATVFVACDTSKITASKNGKELLLPKAENDEVSTILDDDFHTPPGFDDENLVEDELPPESFVGTVIEEDSYYMVVEPNKDEEELEKYGNKVRVEFLSEHLDYRYGIGRKVVITYIPPRNNTPTITTDDIRADGFEDFKLSVQYRNNSIPARFAEIQYAGLLTLIANNRDFDEDASDYNLYYYGLHDVYVTVDGDTLPLIEALVYGKVTIDGIIAECNRLNAISGYSIETSYDDGGSSIFDFGDYKIIKYHTFDGNRDVYIGTSDMDINAKNTTSVCIGIQFWKDWGLRLDIKDVTIDGATVVIYHYGGDETGILQTGEAFYLEKLDGNKWVSYPTRPTIDFVFHQVAYGINHKGKTELTTDWKWLHDSLPEGKYRIAKLVTDFRATGDFDEQVYYAYFEITDTESTVG